MIDKNQLEIIEKTLERGDKIELQPCKNGVIINCIKRKNIGFIEKNKKP